MHRVLKRQLRRLQLAPEAPPTQEQWTELLRRMSAFYDDADQGVYRLERSLTTVSDEMTTLYEKLRQSTTTELAAHRDRLESVLAALGDGLCVLDTAGYALDANPAAELLLGESRTDLIGTCLLGRFGVPDCGVQETLAVAESEGQILKEEHSLKLRDKTELPVAFSLSPVTLGGRREGWVLLFRDVSDRLRRETLLRQTLAEAERALSAKTRFLATMSHELRTPMNGVIGMAGLLLRSPLGPSEQECAETILSSSKDLLKILNDILDYARIESGRVELQAGPFNPGQLHAALVERFAPQAEAKGLKWALVEEPGLPEQLIGDADRLMQVLANLVDNAIKFTETGEVVVRVTLGAAFDERVVLDYAVSDTGSGIAERAREDLFTAFTQEDASMTRRVGGMGLGLAISSQVVEALGGRLAVESRVGQGSTFRFRADLGLAEAAVSTDVVATRLTTSIRVLVVDDNLVNRMVASRVLQKLGHDVALAADGLEALEKVQLAEFDLVLMDCQMPRMDGYEATRRIRELPSHRSKVPIVALTANALPGDADRCLDSGMDAFLSKPVTIEKLETKLAEVLNPLHATAS